MAGRLEWIAYRFAEALNTRNLGLVDTAASGTDKMRRPRRSSHGPLVSCSETLERGRTGTGLGRGIEVGDCV